MHIHVVNFYIFNVEMNTHINLDINIYISVSSS